MSATLLRDPLILAAPPDIEDAALRAALAAGWGLDGALQPLGGERDRNFRLDRADGPPLLVKLVHPGEAAAITDLQTAALLHLAAADPSLPVPRPVRARDGAAARPQPAADGRPCLLRVLTYLPGHPVSGRAPARALGVLAARLDRALGGFAHPAEGRRLVWDLREGPGLRDLLPEVEDPALRSLAAAALDRFEAAAAPALAALPAQLIHNDLNPHNVLVDGGGALSGIIDFGDLLRAPRLQEVATACAYLVEPGADPMAAPAAFLAGYRTVLAVPAAEAALLPVLIAGRMALATLVSSWRARRQPGNAPYITRNLPRVRAGLEALARTSSP